MPKNKKNDLIWDINKERQKAKKVVEEKNFNYLIMFLICMDAFVLGLLTMNFSDEYFLKTLFLLDRLCMAIFIVEMLIKMYAYGPDFFKSRWNVFDLTVVTISAMPIASYFIVLRTFRMFRMLRYANSFKPMESIINVFWQIVPTFFAMSSILGIFLYVFSVMSVGMFGDTFLEFSNISSAMLTLIQTLTLDTWISSIVRPVMEAYPYAWIFFFSFILIGFLIISSFFVSIIKLADKNK